jgi:pantoate--beta-alanine ligase
MQTLDTVDAMVAWAAETKAAGRTIGFVPTMGFLHAGHVSLMRRIRPMVDELVVSIYVNPLQFGVGEDLDRYPRDPEGDSAVCRAEGATALFMPPQLFPDGFSTQVSVHGLTDYLCAVSRPGHMEGVATVCARLFNLVRADVACFGEKDFQQLMMIRRMVVDLAIPTRIVPGALIRDRDNVALSSRNAYLSPDERRRAATLNQALVAIQRAEAEGQKDAGSLLQLGQSMIDCDRPDYLHIMDALTLQPIDRVGDQPARVLVAAYYGQTRLIDNMPLGPEISWT